MKQIWLFILEQGKSQMMNGVRLAIPVFFGLATWKYWVFFSRQGERNKNIARIFYGCGLFLLSLLLIVQGLQLKHFPLAGPFQAIAVFIWFFAILNRIVIIRDRSWSLGVFHSGIIFILISLSMLFIEADRQLPAILQNVYFEIHVVFNLIGYAALSLSFISSLMYILLFHEIKSSRLGFFYDRLPALSYLEKQLVHSLGIGFLFISIGLLIGAYTAKIVWGAYWSWDPKLISAAITWLIYAFTLISRFKLRWKANRLAALSMSAYLWIIFSILIINNFFSNVHSFR